MKLAAIAGLCISASVICRIFDKTSGEYSVMISAAATAAVTAVSLAALMPVVDFINELYGKIGADEEYINILYKTLGICYLTSAASGVCRDSGESSLASAVEGGGRTAIAVMSLPLFKEIISVVENLLQVG
ncbi:MAG: hypothetical protein IJ446_10215 [Oscillospiraceae bacterium]|nr:hypothetical protein [Oscillospiraceae bacterium]